MLIDKFREYLKAEHKKRELIYYKYPIGRLKFHLWIYPRYIWKALRTSFEPKNLTDSDKAQIKVAKRFWKLIAAEWTIWNAISVVASLCFAWGSLPIYGLIMAFLLLFLNARVSFIAFAYLNFKAAEEDMSRIMGYHKGKTVADGRRVLPKILSTDEGREFYREAVRWLYAEKPYSHYSFISEKKYKALIEIFNATGDEQKRLINKLRTLDGPETKWGRFIGINSIMNAEADQYFMQ